MILLPITGWIFAPESPAVSYASCPKLSRALRHDGGGLRHWPSGGPPPPRGEHGTALPASATASC